MYEQLPIYVEGDGYGAPSADVITADTYEQQPTYGGDGYGAPSADVISADTYDQLPTYGEGDGYGAPSADVISASTFAAPIAPVAAVAPVAGYGYYASPGGAPYAAPPTHDAILTTIKLNPGHATFCRVD